MHCNDEIMAQWNFYHHFCIYDFGKRKKNLYEVVSGGMGIRHLGFGYQMYDYGEKSWKQQQRQKSFEILKNYYIWKKKEKKLPRLT